MFRAAKRLTEESIVDDIMLFIIASVLFFAAGAFGGVEAWSQLYLILAVGVLSCIAMLRATLDSGSFSLPLPRFIWVAAVALIVLCCCQLIPLPTSIVARLSPARVAAFKPILADDRVPSELQLSASSLWTRCSLRHILTATFFLVAISAYIRSKLHFMKLLTVVFLAGCLESLLCVAQIFTGAKKLYWTFDPGPEGMLTAGSFVNHSHFSQFVNLALGAGVALLLIRIEDGKRQQPFRGEGHRFNATVIAENSWIVAGLVLCLFAICLSLSRHGILSFCVAAAISGFLLSRSNGSSRRVWLFSILPLSVFGLLLVFGIDNFYERLATLSNGHAVIGRWSLTRAALAAGSSYSLLGSGFGTFALVFPPYDSTGSSAQAVYADNDYAQLFVEGGYLGIAILGMFMASLAYYVLRNLKQEGSLAQAVYGLMLGLIAVALHSSTDFGQRLPGVYLMTVTTIGLIAVLPSLTVQNPHHRIHSDEVGSPSGKIRKMIGVAVILGGSAVFAWMLRDAYYHEQSENWWSNALLDEKHLREVSWKGSEESYRSLLTASENALAWEPDNVEIRYWLNFYRWMAASQIPQDDLLGVELLPGLRQIVRRIVEDLSEIRSDCPEFYRPYLLEGKLRGYVLGDSIAGNELIAMGAGLAPSNAEAQFTLGEWAAYVGDFEEAKTHLQKSIELDGNYYGDSIQLIVQQLNDVGTARDIAAGDPNRLISLADILLESGGFELERNSVLSEAQRIVGVRAEKDEATATELAWLAKRSSERNDHTSAVSYLRRALAKDFSQFNWRLQLVLSLSKLDQVESAVREAKICQRMRPNDSYLRTLLEELEVRASTTSSVSN